jgi:hypothetical protein
MTRVLMIPVMRAITTMRIVAAVLFRSHHITRLLCPLPPQTHHPVLVIIATLVLFHDAPAQQPCANVFQPGTHANYRKWYFAAQLDLDDAIGHT